MKEEKILLSLFFLIVTYLPCYLGLEVRLANHPGIVVFSDNLTNPYYNFTNAESFSDCSYNRIYYEYDSNVTTFTIITNATEKFTPDKLFINNKDLKANYVYNSTNVEDKLTGKVNTTLTMNHYCEKLSTNKEKTVNEAEYYETESNSENWSVIKFQFLDSNSQIHNFEFIKICKDDSVILKALTVICIFGLTVLMTYFSANIEIKLGVVNEIREHNEIKWWHGLVFVAAGSLVLILIFYFKQYFDIIYSGLVIFQCVIFSYLTFLFSVKRGFGSKKLKLYFGMCKRTIFNVKINKILSLLSSILIVFWWFTTKHWILNNSLAFCLVFVILSVLTIKNFKVCVLILLAVFIYDSFWVFFSSKIFNKNVMVTVATGLNLPIKIEMPLLFINNPIKSCMLLGLGDIVLPGMVIKYCKMFDKLKNYSEDKKNYFKLGMLLYCISLVMAFLMMFIFNHAQPVLFYICPIFIIGLGIFACSRKDFYDFWRGDNLTGTQIVVDEIINGEFTRLESNKPKMLN